MPDERKRRTREHVIADMSRVHVESVFIEAGYSTEAVRSDYGYDLIVTTYDDRGYVEPGQVLLQLKASDTIGKRASTDALVFDMAVKDYHLWRREPNPVFLVLYDPADRRAYWLYVQRYFEEEPGRRPKKGKKQVRVRVPKANVVGQAFAAYARSQKTRILGQASGVIRHAE